MECQDLITVTDDLVIKGSLGNFHSFLYQEQFCFTSIIDVPARTTETYTVGAAGWCYTSGLIFSAISVDGQTYTYPGGIEVTTEEEGEVLAAWLNSLQIGLTGVTVTIANDKTLICIRVSCSETNGNEYDIQWGEGQDPYQYDLSTRKTTCDYERVIKDCCAEGKYFVVVIEEEEFRIPFYSAVQSPIKLGPTDGKSNYFEHIKGEWNDKEEEDMLRPNPCKILANANRVVDPKR